MPWSFGIKADNRKTYAKFLELHSDLLFGLSPSERPVEWKILWHIMKYHTYCVCDENCQGDIRKKLKGPSTSSLKRVLEWLHQEGYLKLIENDVWMWPNSTRFLRYTVDWNILKVRLNVDPPTYPMPLKPGDLDKPRIIEPDLGGKENEINLQTILEDF